MTKGRPVRDGEAIRVLGVGDPPEKFYSEGSGHPISPQSAGLNIFINKVTQTVQEDRRTFFVDGVTQVAPINWRRQNVHVIAEIFPK